MKENQFIWWLKGYLENQTYIGEEGVELIKSKLDQVDKNMKTYYPSIGSPVPSLPGTSGVITIPCGTDNNTFTVNTTHTGKTINKQLLND
jgi:hypothetical protein